MINEFRQDLVSGEWVLFSTGLAKKPVDKETTKDFYQPKENCPFEKSRMLEENPPILAYLNGQKLEIGPDFQGEFTVQVRKNKYPVLNTEAHSPVRERGPFKIFDPYGYHELVITKDHDRTMADFSVSETTEVLRVYKERYLEIAKDDFISYVSILHNHGPKAGASRYHNHSQIFGTPIIPPDVMSSLKGAERYYKETGQKVHTVLMEWAAKEKKSIVHENEAFICFCPFASKTPYEVRILPKVSNARFEEISTEDLVLLGDILNNVLKKISIALDKPDYNFYLHTAPISKKGESDYEYYHWHFEIIPRLFVTGGFELGTNIYINPVDPDSAAEKLRNTQI